MGLFSSLLGRGNSPDLDVGTAVMIPMVSAMLADGSIDDDEVTQIRSICLMSPIYANNSRDKDTNIIMRAIKMVDEDGPELMCQKAAGFLSAQLRETALAFAILLVLSDGHVSRKEEELIDKLVAWLSVDPARAEIIIQAAAILRNGEV